MKGLDVGREDQEGRKREEEGQGRERKLKLSGM